MISSEERIPEKVQARPTLVNRIELANGSLPAVSCCPELEADGDSLQRKAILTRLPIRDRIKAPNVVRFSEFSPVQKCRLQRQQ